jgi:HAD superfamily hydrolase (TIGR01509 family)
MMEKAGLTKYIDYMVSNEDVENGKPDPEMYVKAMTHFGCEPQECLIVEDTENGIKAARAAKANLLVVKDVNETNLENILGALKEFDMGK